MKRLFLMIVSVCFSMAALAGNGAPKGAHYNLNIIGVENAKKANMTGSNRHVIFMPLTTSSKGIRSKDPAGNGGQVVIEGQIWLTPGDRFKVCDGNGFDLAYGCADNIFDEDWNTSAECWTGSEWIDCEIASRKEGAVFELPCNNEITDDQDGFIGCDVSLPQASYEVWARALGKPGGSATLTTCATVQGDLQCSTENTVQTRLKGKSPFTDVTDELTSAVVDYCIEFDGDDCIEYETTRIALFSGDTEDWFWNYDGNGLRLLQLRFYEL
ncbi:MAG: hypothetical protein ACI9H8_001368 [Lysobacterales bacterium]|jgi:hypothetical protein